MFNTHLFLKNNIYFLKIKFIILCFWVLIFMAFSSFLIRFIVLMVKLKGKGKRKIVHILYIHISLPKILSEMDLS